MNLVAELKNMVNHKIFCLTSKNYEYITQGQINEIISGCVLITANKINGIVARNYEVSSKRQGYFHYGKAINEIHKIILEAEGKKIK